MLLVWLLRSSERPTSGDVCPTACSGRLADPPPSVPFPAVPPEEPYFWPEEGHGRNAGTGVSIAFDISVLCALQMPNTVIGKHVGVSTTHSVGPNAWLFLTAPHLHEPYAHPASLTLDTHQSLPRSNVFCRNFQLKASKAVHTCCPGQPRP